MQSDQCGHGAASSAVDSGAMAIAPVAMFPDSGHDGTDLDHGAISSDSSGSSCSSSSSHGGVATVALPREPDYSI